MMTMTSTMSNQKSVLFKGLINAIEDIIHLFKDQWKITRLVTVTYVSHVSLGPTLDVFIACMLFVHLGARKGSSS